MQLAYDGRQGNLKKGLNLLTVIHVYYRNKRILRLNITRS